MTRALVLVGSAKPRGTSTSEALGRYFLERLEGGGAAGELLHVASTSLRTPASDRLVEAVAGSDVFVLASPVYTDSLPHLVVRALEGLADRRAELPAAGPRVVGLVNCGFPRAHHCDTALAICRSFARHAELPWAGGLGMGAGELVSGRPLEKVGWPARWVRRALDQAAEALLAGEAVPASSVELMARPLLPARTYTALGSGRWLWWAAGHGSLPHLWDRPHPPPNP